jgi:hypothetical protein
MCLWLCIFVKHLEPKFGTCLVNELQGLFRSPRRKRSWCLQGLCQDTSIFESWYSPQFGRCLLLLIFMSSRRSWRWCRWNRSLLTYFSNYLTFLPWWTFVLLSRFGYWPILLLIFRETLFPVWHIASSVLYREIFIPSGFKPHWYCFRVLLSRDGHRPYYGISREIVIPRWL